MAEITVKRGAGRPSFSSEPTEPFTVRLPAHIVELVKASGGGSLSLGIIRQALGHPPLATVKQSRARARSRSKAAT